MAVRKQTLPNVGQALANNAAFQRMSEAQRFNVEAVYYMPIFQNEPEKAIQAFASVIAHYAQYALFAPLEVERPLIG